jgi:hypothetical protein
MRLLGLRSLLVMVGFAIAPALPPTPVGAQEPPAARPVLQPPAAGKVQRLILKDGSQLLGRILSVDSASVQFESALGVSTIAIDAIVSVREETPGQVHQGRYYFRNPNASRLIFAPSGRMLAKGEGYFSDFWIFFPGVAAGITDRFTIGGGMSIFPFLGFDEQVFFFTPKVGVIQRERFNAAVGALAIAVPNFDDTDTRESAGLLYGVGTWGSTDRSFTAGIGYGYHGGTLFQEPVFMVGGEVRAAPRLSLVTENYLVQDFGLITGGIRFLAQDISVDLALAQPITTTGGFPIPLLGFMWKW